MLGTGSVGAAAARRLSQAGYAVRAWDRVPGRVAALAADGVLVAESASDAVSGAQAVLLLVHDGRDVAKALEAVADRLRDGSLVIDMTTSSVREKREFATRVRAAGARPAEAPFFGTVPQAEAGELFAVLGCDAADEVEARSVLAPLCSGVFRHGGVGDASALKLAANVLVFPMVELIAEALALASAQGVEPVALLRLLEAGTGVRSPIYQARGRLMIEHDFAPRASVELAVKDLDLIHEAARGVGLELPLLEQTRTIFGRAREAGLAGEDMAAVYKLVETHA